MQRLIDTMGISQAELARRVGMSQSALNSLARGDTRSSPRLHVIARELGTTAAYLSGETDDPAAEVPAISLNHEERQWIEYYHQLGEPERRSFITIMRSLIEGPPSPHTLNNDRRSYQAEA